MSSKQDMNPVEIRQVDSQESQNLNMQDSDKSQIELLNTLVTSLLQLMGPQAPAIIPGALYHRQQVQANLHVSDKTVTWWKDNGLKAYRPATSKDLFFGDDIIQFAKDHPDLLAPKSYQEQQAQRQKVQGNAGKEEGEQSPPRKRRGSR